MEPRSELAFNTIKLDVPLELMIELPELFIVKALNDKALLTKSRLPPDNVNVFVDMPKDEPEPLNLKVPALTVVLPLNVLAPDSVNKPSPAFVRFISPEIMPVIALVSDTVTLNPDREVKACALNVCASTVRLLGVESLDIAPVIVTEALALEIVLLPSNVTGPVNATPVDPPPPLAPFGLL